MKWNKTAALMMSMHRNCNDDAGFLSFPLARGPFRYNSRGHRSRGIHETKRQTVLCDAAMTSIRRVHHGSARHPTNSAKASVQSCLPYKSECIYTEVDVKTDPPPLKKNVYTFVYIAMICFFSVCIFLAAILMPRIRLYWVEYGSCWCCDVVITGCQRGELYCWLNLWGSIGYFEWTRVACPEHGLRNQLMVWITQSPIPNQNTMSVEKVQSNYSAWDCFPKVKWPGWEANHSPPKLCQGYMELYINPPPYAIMMWTGIRFYHVNWHICC
jgi:hypothetical protein